MAVVGQLTYAKRNNIEKNEILCYYYIWLKNL